MMFYENGKLNFNTQLTQSGFTKARFSDRLNEQGLLAEKIGEDWNFSPYEFSGTYEKDNYVFLEGNGFAGRELSELISSEKKETALEQYNLLKEKFPESKRLEELGKQFENVTTD